MKRSVKEIPSYLAKIILVVSLVVAAGVGILILASGEFGEIELRVLLTTFLIGIFSIVSLGSLMLAGTRFELWGWVGVASGVLSLLLSFILLWGRGDFAGNSAAWIQTIRYALASGVVSVAIGHQSLLLKLVGKGSSSLFVWITCAFIAAVAVVILAPIIANVTVNETYWRILGTLAILDVLGTIIAPIMVRFSSKK